MPIVANVTPRRKTPSPAKPGKKPDPAPWRHGDPTRKLGLNIPIPEPLMMQLDYLIEHRAISSKASFIREVVERAAEAEIKRVELVREAMRRVEAESKR